jgi:hypothetical protein
VHSRRHTARQEAAQCGRPSWTAVTYLHFNVSSPVAYCATQAALVQIDASAGRDQMPSLALTGHEDVPGPGEVIKEWLKKQGFAAALQAAGAV